MQPTLGKRAFVPTRFLATCRVARHLCEKKLTFTHRVTTRLAAIQAEMASDDPDDTESGYEDTLVTVNEYKACRGGVSFPRAWAVENFPTLSWVDNTDFPRFAGKYRNGPTPRDDRQRTFFEQLNTEANQVGPQDILANADTGAGKSVAGIWLGQALHTPTLILVDQNKLANGWLKNMHKFYGREWCDKYVGRVQRDVCNYEGKAFVIGILQSIVRRNYGEEFYANFGLVIFDEIQIYGSASYIKALGMFSARVRVGFTAENRSGSFGRMIKTHLGDTRVVSRQKVLTAKAYLIKNVLEKSVPAYSDGTILTGLSRLGERNKKLARLIDVQGFRRGRNVLVLSDRTEQLVQLRQLCIARGIPADAMGLHMGKYVSHRTQLTYSYKNKGGGERTIAAYDTHRQAVEAAARFRQGQYPMGTPAALIDAFTKNRKSVILGYRREVYAPSQQELDNITNSCQIVFATYQIFSKGVDVPRLDMGVEALPSGNLKQPLGRILRILDGKPQPEWYAICDEVKVDELFGTTTNSNDNLLQMFLRGKTQTRIEALKRAKAELSYAA